ncbi:MAG: hypothetical protein AAF810_13855 [Cyanobacteria bacterium P01_D01_bin.36]
MVVELTRIDKREATVDQVQRDMNRAMEYMTDELRESVYVYDDPTPITDQLTGDSDYPTGAVPVIAFWKLEPIVSDDLPDCTSGDEDFERLCKVLHIRQSAYTLVVYFQQENDAGDRKWSGQSRIIRYELSRYSAAGISTLTERSGYRDPTSATDSKAPFEKWEVADGEVPSGSSNVLVDYVQAPDSGLSKAPLVDVDNDGASAPCFDYGFYERPLTEKEKETIAGTTKTIPFYRVSPPSANTTTNTSFFACVRNPDPDDDEETINRTNQDVYVFLRGSTEGSGIRSFSDESSLPILETQVIVRGVVDKSIQ